MKILPSLFVIIAFLTSCDNGANKSADNEGCETTQVTFKNDVLPIFEQNCFSCHNEEDYARKADGNKMDSYELIKLKIDDGLVLGNIKHEKGFVNMPYRKKQLEPCDIQTIEIWINNGALND